MSVNVQIRPANVADIAAMSRLLSQLFSIEADFTPDEEKQQRGLQLLLDSPEGQIVVAEGQGAIIGMATVQVLISTAEGGRVGLVEDVIVDQHYRGRGVGTALLNGLQQWAEEHGLSRLQLAADRNNTTALEFYARNCWERTNLLILRHGTGCL